MPPSSSPSRAWTRRSIDPRSVRPLDEEIILRSLRKTGHLVVADTSWALCGFAAEVAAVAAEKGFASLKRRCAG